MYPKPLLRITEYRFHRSALQVVDVAMMPKDAGRDVQSMASRLDGGAGSIHAARCVFENIIFGTKQLPRLVPPRARQRRSPLQWSTFASLCTRRPCSNDNMMAARAAAIAFVASIAMRVRMRHKSVCRMPFARAHESGLCICLIWYVKRVSQPQPECAAPGLRSSHLRSSSIMAYAHRT